MTLVRHEGQLHNPAKGPCKNSPLEGSTRCRRARSRRTGLRYTSRHSVNERIKAVCARAGIACKPSHTCGRHSFTNNTLALGVDVKTAMEAGGWKSPSAFLGTYVNPHNAGRLVAERLKVYQYDSTYSG